MAVWAVFFSCAIHGERSLWSYCGLWLNLCLPPRYGWHNGTGCGRGCDNISLRAVVKGGQFTKSEFILPNQCFQISPTVPAKELSWYLLSGDCICHEDRNSIKEVNSLTSGKKHASQCISLAFAFSSSSQVKVVPFESFATFKVSSVFVYPFITPSSQEITTVRSEKKCFVEELFIPSAKYQICSQDGLVPWPIVINRQLILRRV